MAKIVCRNCGKALRLYHSEGYDKNGKAVYKLWHVNDSEKCLKPEPKVIKVAKYPICESNPAVMIEGNKVPQACDACQKRISSRIAKAMKNTTRFRW